MATPPPPPPAPSPAINGNSALIRRFRAHLGPFSDPLEVSMPAEPKPKKPKSLKSLKSLKT